jgi:ornithine cyclodeaminase/alanine dehydrogenase-like protein (mu-crystallin family)
MRTIDREEIAQRLTYEVCIPIVREAMIAFSSGKTRQLLRSYLPLGEGRLFGIMPGALGEGEPFGAKLISVYPENFNQGLQSHQGLVILFEPTSGAPVCTAAASAVATDALARRDASTMAIIGYGEQAHTHARAICKVRDLRSITVWGRSSVRAEAFASRMSAELGIPVRAARDAREAVAEADIVCTVTAAREPVVLGAWIRPGTHLNIVGSSVPGPVEVDSDLVVRSRYVVDSREGILRAGAEFLTAKEAGLIGDDHIASEIGEVCAGTRVGRRSERDITIYKSIGHIVQDLACGWALYAGSIP